MTRPFFAPLIASFTLLLFVGSPIRAEGWARIANGHAVIVYDGGTRTWEIADDRGEVLVSHLSGAVEIGEALYPLHDGGREPKVRSGRFKDDLGTGKEIEIQTSLLDGLLEVRQSLKIYRGGPRILVETSIRNTSPRTIEINGILPLLTTEESGGLFARGLLEGWSLLLESFELSSTPQLQAIDGPCSHQGYWSGALWNRNRGVGAVLGFRAPVTGVGSIDVGRKLDTLGFSLALRVGLFDHRLAPGKTIAANTVVLRSDRSLLGAMRNESQFLFPPQVRWNAPEKKKRPPSVWVARHIERRPFDLEGFGVELDQLRGLAPYGLEVVLLDESLAGTPLENRSRTSTNRNRSNPLSVLELTGEIRSRGFRPGISISPFLIGSPSPAAVELRESLVLDPTTSKPLPLTPESSWVDFLRPPTLPGLGEELTCLDPTSPTARYWLQNGFRDLRSKYGIDYYHLGDLALAAPTGTRHRPETTPLEATGLGLEWIREALGRDCYLHGSGALLGTTFPELDGLSLGPQTSADWRWFPELLKLGSRRFSLSGTSFFGHLAPLYLGGELSLWEARSFATLHGILGGGIHLMDRPSNLDRERKDLLKKILPPLATSATPVDLFESEVARCFKLSLKKPFRRDLIALFNPTDQASVESLDLAQMGLRAGTNYHGYEFWTNSYLGVLRDRVAIPLAPRGCAAVQLVEADFAHPKLLSSLRHLSQGSVGVQSTFFDRTRETLFVNLNGIAGEPLDVLIHVPPAYSPNPEILRPHSDRARVDLRNDGLLGARVVPDETGPVQLHLRFPAPRSLASQDSKRRRNRTRPEKAAPSSVRSRVLHVGSGTDPILQGLSDAGVDLESLDPRHGSAARALLLAFLLEDPTRIEGPAPNPNPNSSPRDPSTPAPSPPPSDGRVLILSTDCLTFSAFSPFEEKKHRQALLSFLRRGGSVVWMPQSPSIDEQPLRIAPQTTPPWLNRALELSCAPALSGLLDLRFDDSLLPDGSHPTRSDNPLASLFQDPPGDPVFGAYLACPSLPVRTLGVGTIEIMGQAMARLAITPVGKQQGLLAAAGSGVEKRVVELVTALSRTETRGPFFELVNQTRREWVALESRSSLLTTLELEPLLTDFLDVGDPESETKFSHATTSAHHQLFDRITRHSRTVSDTGLVYSGRESFEIDRSELGDRDLVIASLVNTHRRETGVSVTVDGRWLFDHRYTNFSGDQSPGWNLEFLHIRNHELGPRTSVTIELSPLSSLKGSSYRYGFFKGPRKQLSYLSDLDPASVDPPTAGVALDRNVHGGLLTGEDRVYYKGLGLSPDTRVVYALNGAYRRFVAQVSVDREAAALSRVRFRVYLDGQIAFESPEVNRDAAPIPIDLDVTGVHRLEIESVDGHGILPAELANWGDAHLVAK